MKTVMNVFNKTMEVSIYQNLRTLIWKVFNATNNFKPAFMWSDIVFKSITNNIWNGPFRSSRPEVSCEKGVLRNFAKFTAKHLCRNFFFNKACNFIKKETLAQVFSCEFCEISKNTFSYRTPLLAASALYNVTSI